LQSVIAGFGNADFSIGEQDVKDYYVIPMFKSLHIDFMIDVRGSSMQPKYNSGDIIACTIMHERSFIQWNKCHVIATREQGIIVKRLRKSDKQGYLTAVSDNKDYPPFEIPESGITGIALVVGVVRLE
jgi:phage repressor protein C with HTH and peptisase S24 domain